MTDEETTRLIKYLGLSRPEEERYLRVASRDSSLAKNLLRKKIREAGGDPDDLAAFPLVHVLPLGVMKVGRVINGNAEGPIFAIPAATANTLQHIAVAGETRFGKSRATMLMVMQHIQAGGSCWIFDFEHEYDLLVSEIPGERQPVPIRPSDLRINFWQPPHELIHWKTWSQHLGMVFRGDFFLRDPSLNLTEDGVGVLMRRKNFASRSGNYPSLYEVYR